jgi:hypothetical protein
MSPEELAVHFDRAAVRWETEAKAAVRVTLQDLEAEAIAATSGTLSEADLRALDHPYARRHGAPKLDPNVVNVGTGKLRSSWETEGPIWVDGELTGSLWNADPKAEYLSQEDPPPSTTTMFARRPHEKAAAAVEPRFQRRMDAALAAALE